VSARTPQHSLAAQTTIALGLAFVLSSGIHIANSPAASIHQHPHGACGRLALSEVVRSAAAQDASDADSSGPALKESNPEELSQADVVHLAEESGESLLLTSRSMMPLIPCDQRILVSSPDHLIELPGTPPPGLI
jgi:hypothetical protein